MIERWRFPGSSDPLHLLMAKLTAAWPSDSENLPVDRWEMVPALVPVEGGVHSFDVYCLRCAPAEPVVLCMENGDIVSGEVMVMVL